MCIDYCTLNARTVVDQYAVPRVQEALDCLLDSKWFSVLDLCSSYYQIPVQEANKENTTFICPLSFYQFECMPHSISGALATFQRLMEKVVGDLYLTEVLIYLDDIFMFGIPLEEHVDWLLHVLDQLEAAGLKLAIGKCKYCQASVKCVGHIVSQDRISTDPEKVSACDCMAVAK